MPAFFEIVAFSILNEDDAVIAVSLYIQTKCLFHESVLIITIYDL